MSEVYKAVVGLRYPDNEDGVGKARKAKTQEDFEAISWATSAPGDIVPEYVIKASPWLIEQGKVAKDVAPAEMPEKTAKGKGV